jgi:hypothetical protein
VRISVLAPLALLAATAVAVPSYAGASVRHAPASSALSGTETDVTTTADRGVQPVSVPKEARAVGTRNPAHVIGDGTPASCTSRKVVRAVGKGGVTIFHCGPNPVVIRMRHTAMVNNTHSRVVLDGGGLVTLSGVGKRRILYENACDPRRGLRLRNCQDSPRPHLVVQNIGLADGNSSGSLDYNGGGGAIFSYGGRLKVVNATFTDNRCDRTGPDLGGGAVRARFQYHNLPVYVVHSTFVGGRCSNGAALSSINVSWTVLNSVFRGNRAIGYGANPPRSHTPGGGSGGAIYTDGETYTVRIAGTLMRRNHANEGGGAVFYVSNDRSGRLHIHWSTLKDNVSERFETRPGIFYLGHGPIDSEHSIIR